MTMEKTFNSNTVEGRIYSKWEDEGCFKAGANASINETFCIMIPPPNVTGILHMGHAFNNTLQDILVRWHRMRGYDTLWQPGQDHAGIATQMVVERQLSKDKLPSRKELGRDLFLEKVWEWKEQSGGTIIDQLKRLGASCDWSRNAFTMDEHFQKAVLKVFVEMYNKGLIYRGTRLVNWDPKFETAISDLEVENIEIDGKFFHFKYLLENGETYSFIEKDEDGQVILEEERNYIAIATTRPETMLGDGAVAVHPSDERYKQIIGKKLHLPLCDRLIPIIEDEYPDPSFGSGAVKITGAHDFNDYAVAKRNNIPLYPLLDTKGNLRDDNSLENTVPEKYKGLERFVARERIVSDMNALNLTIKIEDKKIMQPIGDRSKVVIEPMLTNQWFVDTKKIVQPAIDAVKVGETRIIPERDEKVYFHWLENIEPWCISRQLWWGHQIPVWFDTDGNEYCATTEEEAQEMAPGKVLTRDPDVLDTWFSSGIWPIGTLGWPENTEELKKYYPTNVLVTGFDIIFFWVARMMMMQYAIMDQKPFSTVYVHALVRDETGQKMSKSSGNVLDPIELIEEYGADSVRFTLTAMAAMGRDLKLSTQRIAGYRNFGTKLWNAARFAEMNGCKLQDSFSPSNVTHNVNKWIVGETGKVRELTDNSLANYRFNDVANGLYAFVWGKVCDWYVEFSKPLLNNEDQTVVDETKNTLAWVLDQCLILLHPIMPFITEELWSSVGKHQKLLIHADWPTYGTELIDSVADQEMNWAINLIENIRSVRGEMNVPAGLKIPLIMINLDNSKRPGWNFNTDLIMKLARIEKITENAKLPKGCVNITVNGGEFALPLAEIIDISSEKKRLEKNLTKIENEIRSLKGRLENNKFLESAPETVVAQTQVDYNLKKEEIEKITNAINRLKDIEEA
jgi:valyl-tRNA synthetase